MREKNIIEKKMEGKNVGGEKEIDKLKKERKWREKKREKKTK